MDIHFGRVITEKKNGTIKTKIKAIDDNKQTEEGQVIQFGLVITLKEKFRCFL